MAALLAQKVVTDAEIEAVGKLLTVTEMAEDVAVHPPELVTITV